MIALIARGISLGFAAGSIPGPLHTFLIKETLLRGGSKSIIIILAPFTADLPLILLMVLVLDRLPDGIIRILQIVGGLFILTLARGAWRQARTAHLLLENPSESNSSVRITFWRALLVNWLNPAPYIFWGTVNGPLLVKGLDQSLLHGLAFLAAFYGTFMVIMVGVVVVFHAARRLDARLVRGMVQFSALVLFFFGLSLIWQGIH